MRPLRLSLFVILLLAFATSVFAQESFPVSIDETKSVTIEISGSPVDLIYRAPQAQTINVQARSLVGSTLDTTLEVLDAAQVRLAYNDDHGTSRADLNPFDSLITALDLPAAGDYLIRVGTFSGAAAGQVEVTLTLGTTPIAPNLGDTPVETVRGEVPSGDRFIYPVQLAAGTNLTITVRAIDNALDPKVALVNPEGVAVATNDDHGTQDTTLSRYDSRIANFAITASGQYQIEVSGFGGIGGVFELIIERDSASDEPRPQPGVETVRGTVIAGVPFQHYIDANAGDVLVITAAAITESLDVDVGIYDLQDNLLDANYEHGSTDPNLFFYDARINNFIVQQTGTFLIEVVGFRAGSTERASGDFTLTIERVGTGAPLGTGTSVVFLGEITPNGRFTQPFTARAGDFVTITVRALTTGFDPLVDLISPDGVLLANNDDHGISDGTLGRFDSQIVRYRIPTDGEYTIEVGGFRDTAGSFGITITTIR
ncbi:MAG: hypothetical protein CUN53_05425 [Phototrophicales bacterium]|nr:MAG: hypothetical protein CUN53_05425 [Phototrophicales bacterium]